MRTMPASGVSNALRQRRMVVFPDPDGPMMTTTLPVATSKEMPSQHPMFAKGLVHAAHRQPGRRACLQRAT